MTATYNKQQNLEAENTTYKFQRFSIKTTAKAQWHEEALTYCDSTLIQRTIELIQKAIKHQFEKANDKHCRIDEIGSITI